MGGLRVRALLSRGTHTQCYAQTPLHMAAESGSAACAELLLAAKASVARDAYGLSPLDIAVQNKYLDVQAVLSRES